jgi:hypothetical protein
VKDNDKTISASEGTDSVGIDGRTTVISQPSASDLPVVAESPEDPRTNAILVPTLKRSRCYSLYNLAVKKSSLLQSVKQGVAAAENSAARLNVVNEGAKALFAAWKADPSSQDAIDAQKELDEIHNGVLNAETTRISDDYSRKKVVQASLKAINSNMEVLKAQGVNAFFVVVGSNDVPYTSGCIQA